MKRSIHIFILILLIQFLFIVNAFADEIIITGETAVLIEQNTGKIIYEKNKDKKVFPASTTKIVTAILALEHGDLKDLVSIGEEIQILPGDSSTANLSIGQKIYLEDLLYGLLLPSGNDAANSIAVYIAEKINNEKFPSYEESIKYFIELMNIKAREIGATNTNFTNPHGYHDNNHYTSPIDMGIITREAMKNSKFREIVSSIKYEYIFSNKINTIKHWKNYNELLLQNSKNYYPYATGVKTGRTSEAGRCLISSATKGNLNIISALFRSNEDSVWEDSVKLLSYGIDNYRYHTIAEKGQVIIETRVKKSQDRNKNKLKITTNELLQVLINKEEIPEIQKKLIIKNGKAEKELRESNINLIAPIEKGQAIGYVKYFINDKEIAKAELVAGNTIKKINCFTEYWWLFLLLLLIGITIIVKTKKTPGINLKSR